MDLGTGPKYSKEHQTKVSKWIHEGTSKAMQSVTVNSITGLIGTLKGENFGKAVLLIAELDGKINFS